MIETIAITDIRNWIRQNREFAFLDVREESAFSRSQPLFSVNLPLGRIAERARAILPRQDVPIVLFDNNEGLVKRAIRQLNDLGYFNIQAVEGDLIAWRAAGGELFRDVGVPSKAFGEWLEAHAHTPSISAEELKRLIDAKADVVVLDSRPFSEYGVMTVPTSINCPGAELVLRAPSYILSPDTLVVVNCAGRTRSIIGAQSLINSGLFNRVAALRNGTIGWLLAGFELERGADRKLEKPNDAQTQSAAAKLVAQKNGVRFLSPDEIRIWETEASFHSLFRFDVRSPEETNATHAPGYLPAPGGQLVQATDEYIGVRGARIVLGDDDGVRACMTASWLRQMGWEHVAVVADGLSSLLQPGPHPTAVAEPPFVPTIDAPDLAKLMKEQPVTIVDIARSSDYAKGHIPGAWFAVCSRFAEAIPSLPRANLTVLTSSDGSSASLALADFQALSPNSAVALRGGTLSWRNEGLPLEAGLTRLAVPADDIYKRPYEGTDSPREAMQAYLDWEFGLVEQIRKDGTANYRVLKPENIAGERHA